MLRPSTRLALCAAALALAAPPALGQDVTADPTYDTAVLQSGFAPDPYTVDVVAGGTLDVSSGVDGCAGMIAEAPDVNLEWSAEGSALYVYAASSVDTTLLVNLPDGSWLCDDGFGDGDAFIGIPDAESGLYNIWVGTLDSESAEATLAISEIDPY